MRMLVGGEHEANAGLGHRLRNALGREVDVGPQGFKHVGAARLAADAAPPVLGGSCTGCSSDKHRAGRYIEGVRAVSAGTDDVDQMFRIGHMHLGRKLPHDLGGRGDLANGFLFHAQTSDDGRRHQWREFAVHDHPHELEHLVVEDLAVFDGALQGFLGGNGHDGLGFSGQGNS